MVVILLVFSVAWSATGGIILVKTGLVAVILLVFSVACAATGGIRLVKTGPGTCILLLFSVACILLPAGKPAVVIHI